MESYWKFIRNCGRPERKVTLAILGLDNAGKTATIRSIQGGNPEDVSPTVGFSPVDLRQGQYDVSIFDLGGAEQIRDMWKHYFAECHGVMFVVDSSDVQRMQETKDTLAKVLRHPCITGKPVLLLANKQDREGALQEADIIDHLSLVNQNKCLCKIVPYSAVMTTGKKAIQRGLEWLLKTVGMGYNILNERVQKDTAEQREQEEKYRRERAERVRKIREERERRAQEEAEREEAEGKPAELDQGEKSIMDDPVQPFGDIIPEMVTKTESKKDSGEKTDQADHSPKRKRTLHIWRKNRVAPLTQDGPAKTRGCLKSWFGWLKRNVVTPQ